MQEDDLLSLRDAATALDRSRMTVVRHIQAGDLKAEKVGPVYVIRRSDLEAFQARQRPPGRPKKPPE